MPGQQERDFMYISNANFCIGEASKHQEADMYVCSLVEKIALDFTKRQNIDFRASTRTVGIG